MTTTYNGYDTLKEYLQLTETPSLMDFIETNEKSFITWHRQDDTLTGRQLLAIWKPRFIEMHQQIYNETISVKLTVGLNNIASRFCRARNLLNQESVVNSDYYPSSEEDIELLLNEPFILGGYNISAELHDVKTKALTRYDKGFSLSDRYKLALDNVFSADSVDCTSPLIAYSRDVLFSTNDFYANLPSTSALELINKVFRLIKLKRVEEAKRFLNMTLAEDDEEEVNLLATVLRSMIICTFKEGDDESIFTELITNICKPAFNDPLLHVSGSQTRLYGHKFYVPDLKYDVIKHRLDLLVIEIKKPSNCNSDYYKLIMEMRHMLTKLALFGINDPTVFGVRVAGYKVYYYQMKLISKGVYFFTLLDESPLPSTDNIYSCLQTLPVFARLGERVKQQAALITAATPSSGEKGWTTKAGIWDF